ncbi:MAG: peptide chain release factor N(5)-glutamine methyltransferase [Candidatus Omnitrophica bacterium]|nr:peptide chain release factor N(5)-glutamine methyltransferase [Candidatus Omnitrophota bacterium]
MNKQDTTIGKALSAAECLLSQAGIVSAEKEAVILLGFFLDLKRIDVYFIRNEILNSDILIEFQSAVNKRCAYFPLQYLTGETFFYGLRLVMREGVFIPRPETEILVEKIIKIAEKNFPNGLKILELCTGSGNISVSLTKNIQYCTIISSDINKKALDLSRHNACIHGVSEQIKFIQSDLFEALDSQDYQQESNRFEIIVANPPYVSFEQMNELPADVLNEPKEALYGGNDGLDFYRKIIGQTRNFLKKSGYIAFEFGDKQAKDIEQIIQVSKLFDQTEFFADLNGIYRFVIARRING